MNFTTAAQNSGVSITESVPVLISQTDSLFSNLSDLRGARIRLEGLLNRMSTQKEGRSEDSVQPTPESLVDRLACIENRCVTELNKITEIIYRLETLI